MLGTVTPQADGSDRELLEALDESMDGGGVPSPDKILALLDDPQARGVIRSIVHGLARGLRVDVVVHDEANDLSPQQAADLLGVSRKLVTRLLDEGRLPYHTLPGSAHKKVSAEHVVALLAEQQRKRRGIDEIMDHLDVPGVVY